MDQERELILRCLRAQCEGEAIATLPVDREAIDWERVQALAAVERVAPLLYAVVRDRNIVPFSVEVAWRDAYYATARRNLLLGHELTHVLRALQTAGIPAIVLKGAALAETAYGNLALRPMLDLDLLVRPDTLPRVIDLMNGLGYAATQPEMRRGTVATYENEILLCKPQGADFDIHWSLFDSPFHQDVVDLEWFWTTARPLRVESISATTLSPEATLVHLCGHVWLHHGGNALLWLHDVARVITSNAEAIDWDELLRRAQRYQLILPIQRVLTRIADTWRVAIPAAVLRDMHALVPSPEELRTFRSMTVAHRSVAQRLWSDLLAMRGWRKRAHFAWTLLFPSAAYMRQRYRIRHRLLVPPYYLYRWLRGLWG